MGEVDRARIEEAAGRLQGGLSPTAIFLYGSHAYGEPHEDSDVDLLVVVEDLDEPAYEVEAEAYRRLSGLRLPVEIQVVTREDVERRAESTATIEQEVKERGVELYAAS